MRKTSMSFLLSLMCFFNEIGEQEGRTGCRSGVRAGGGGSGPDTVYTYE
jgi:hypothetical protein